MTGPDHIGEGISEMVKRAQVAMDARKAESEEAQRRARETRWDDDADHELKCLPGESLAAAREIQAGGVVRSAAFRAMMELPPGPGGILLSGPSGSGKTVALCGAALRASYRRPPPTMAYLSCATLEVGREIPDPLWWAQLAIIDDLHLIGAWLPYRQAPVHALLDARQGKRLLTLCATEWTRSAMCQLIGVAITDRAGRKGRSYDVQREGINWRDR